MFAGLISCFYSWEWKQESCKAQRELGTPANWQNYSMNNSFPLSRWRFEDVGESDSKLWKDRRVNFIQGSIAGRLDNFPGSVETSSCLLNQKHQHLVRIKIAGGLHGWCTNQKKMQSMDCMSQFQNIVLRVADQPLNQTRKMAMTTAGCECFEMCSRHRKALWQAMVWFHFCRRGVFMFDGQIPTVHGKTNCYRSPSHQAFSCVSIFSIQLKPQVLMVRSQFKTHFSICFPMFFLSSVSSLVGLEMSGVCQPRPSRDGGLNTGIRGITTWQLTHISLPSK